MRLYGDNEGNKDDDDDSPCRHHPEVPRAEMVGAMGGPCIAHKEGKE